MELADLYLGRPLPFRIGSVAFSLGSSGKPKQLGERGRAEVDSTDNQQHLD